MIQKKTFIQQISASLCALALLAACTDEVQLDNGGGTDEGAYETYLRLTVRCPETPAGGVQTRSNPTGGENGDGHEPGQDYETRIDDLMLLFYQGDQGVNSSASTPIDKIMYLDRNAMQGDNRTEPVKVGLPGGWYDLLVITNTGNIRPQLQGKTLGDVRDYLQKQAWTESDGRYSRFVMSSNGHEDEQVYICGDNTADNPASATVEVERHAARIDYRARHKVYDVTDKTYGRAVASITGGMVLNKMHEASYLVKRTAMPDGERLTASSPLTYLGDELPVEGGVQRNYVRDPWSLQKTAKPVDTSLSRLYANYYTSFDKKQSVWEPLIQSGMPLDNDWLRLDYTLENTMSREAQLDAYRTMVVFQVRYTPEGYEPGKTFYRVKDKIFPTRAEAAKAAEGTGALVREYHNGLCYYVWRVRHSNDDRPGELGIMEYAIVRNNIYRLLISSIYGLGDEVPFPDPDGKDPDKPDEPTDPDKPTDPDDPDKPTDPDNPEPPVIEDPKLRIEVTVKPWGALPKETIIF